MVKDHSDSERGNPLPPLHTFRLTARVLLYPPCQRQEGTYHGLCYTSRGALAVTRNSSMGPHTIMAETDCDVVHCPISGNKHWLFDPRFVDVVNQFAHCPTWRLLGCYRNVLDR